MKPVLRRAFPVTLAVCAGFVFVVPSLFAAKGQAAAAPAAATRLLGTVTAIQGNNVTIKTDAGAESVITVGGDTRMLRTEPGQKSLSGATPIHVQDLAVGDRVLARATPAADGKSYTASLLIAMSHADIAKRQEQEREDWQKNGVGGIVKSVDPAANTVTIATSGSHTVVIHATPSTVVRHYAPDSVQFDQSKPSTLGQVHPGDQLRARGSRGANGGITAAAIVVGSFRNIAGVVKRVNKGAGTITVTDLATKKPVTISFTSDSQIRKLPPEMAQTIAANFHGEGAGAHGPAMKPSSGGTASSGQESTQQGEGLGQMLQRAPSIQIAALHKGDAVMIVATEGTPDAATAITLLAGVEPLLQSSASQGVFSASWNLSGNGGEQAAQ